MHRIGAAAGVNDDFAGVDLDALAAADQFVGVVLAVENLRKPVAQVGFLLLDRKSVV